VAEFVFLYEIEVAIAKKRSCNCLKRSCNCQKQSCNCQKQSCKCKNEVVITKFKTEVEVFLSAGGREKRSTLADTSVMTHARQPLVQLLYNYQPPAQKAQA
jgi:hypothetical protein